MKSCNAYVKGKKPYDSSMSYKKPAEKSKAGAAPTIVADKIDKLLFDHKHKSKNSLKAALVKWRDEAVVAELEKLSMEVVEPCEPECSPVRHARHEGTWQAHLIIDDRIATLTKENGEE